MKAKRNILAIEPHSPVPTESGGQLRSKKTLLYLSKYYKLSCFYFLNTKKELAQNRLFFNKHKIKNSYFLLKTKNFFLFFLQGIPYWFSPWFSKKLIEKINKSKQKNMLIETSQLLYLLGHIKTQKHFVYVAQDIATVSFYRRLKEAKFMKRIILLPALIQIYFYELRLLPKANLIITMSDHDSNILKRYFHCKKTKVIPNGVSFESFGYNKWTGQLCLGYIGGAEHTPNIVATNFLVKKISDYLTKNNVEHTIYIVGKGYNFQNSENLIYKPFVKNLKDFYNKITCLVVPLKSGSGSRIKILESLSYGVPVVTTKIGAEGIDLNTKLLRIVNQINNLSEWSNLINESNDKISTENLKIHLSKYNWETVFKAFHQIFPKYRLSTKPKRFRQLKPTKVE